MDATENGVQAAVDSGYEAKLEAEAKAAVETILKSQDWAGWLKYGEYCASGRNACMLRAGTNEPVGMKYNKAMNAWLTDRPWVCDIDKVSRSHAVWCFDNREALEKLRDNMGSEKQKKNHPTVMKRAFERSQKESEKAPTKAKGPSKAEIEQQLALMTDERDKWKKKAEQANDFEWSAPVKLIVGVAAQSISQNKLVELAKALKAEADRRAKIKNGGAK